MFYYFGVFRLIIGNLSKMFFKVRKIGENQPPPRLGKIALPPKKVKPGAGFEPSKKNLVTHDLTIILLWHIINRNSQYLCCLVFGWPRG